MPIFQLGGRGFETADVRAICDAFDGAWASLVTAGGTPIESAQAFKVRDKLAKRILEIAKIAPTPLDAAVLRDDALNYLRDHPP
jgi:hypothetical protein